jgi:O-succinylbenzoate synthase
MQIDSIEVFHIALPLRQPVQAAGRQLDKLETVLVRMQSGDLAGWGEASPGNAPLAGPEWAAGVFACLRDWLAPALKGQWIESGDQLAERLAFFRGNRFAKAALDTAWWDLSARKQGRPLHQLLDGRRDAIEVGPTFDRMDSIDDFLSALSQAFQAGFTRVKLKFRPGWEVQMVDFVRKEFPIETFHIDVEGALSLGHMEMLCRLDDFSLAMIEQPLPADDLVGHAMVQETVRTPICLDEGITTLAQAEMALELKSCRWVNLKPGRVGGLTSAVAIHDACQRDSVGCYVGAVPQSALGARIGLALAAKANCTYPADFFPADQVLGQDLAQPLLPVRDERDGRMRVPLWSEPGLGVEPQPEVLKRCCVDRAKL